MESAAIPALRAALGRILEEPSPGTVTLPEAQRLAGLAGLNARLMCAVVWAEHRASLAVSTTELSPRLVLRFDDDRGPDGSVGAMLSSRRQIDEDTWAYPIELPCMTTRFFLRLASGAAYRDVGLVEGAYAVVRTHGWRDDLDPDTDIAEAMVDAKDLAEAIVQLTGIDPEKW